ncbi:MAG: HD domain-containing protein [Bacteroidota bacterium]
MNKRKILNDPVHGFITFRDENIFDLVEHHWFQRLRRIRQLGMTSYVYPGALHTRFQHAIGAMHLMNLAIDTLRSKEIDISKEESAALNFAILLHDIGHGPFSHALEHTLVSKVPHESISGLFMNRMNEELNGILSLAIRIFNNMYDRPFLRQLVASQLDMDRLDYLKRDSFFTGVSEGVVNTERIITMLNVHQNNICIEEKGIYSVEKFLVARRLMYWQVYYHKTTVAAEQMMVGVLKRARELYRNGDPIYASPALSVFLEKDYSYADFERDPALLNWFAMLDDVDIQMALKMWTLHSDSVLSRLSNGLVNRNLFRSRLSNQPWPDEGYEDLLKKAAKQFGISIEEAGLLVNREVISNHAYQSDADHINVLYRDGSCREFAEASDHLQVLTLGKPVEKYVLCYPKELDS